MFQVGQRVIVLEDPELEVDTEYPGTITALLEQSITPGWSIFEVTFDTGEVKPISEVWFKPPPPPRELA